MDEKRNYYAILPAEVRYDTELSASEKIFFAELTALSNEYGYCFASNNYFAQLYEVDPSTVSKWITNLKNKGYVNVDYIYDGKVIKERHISILKGTEKTPIGVLNKSDEGTELIQGGTEIFQGGSEKTPKIILNNNNKHNTITSNSTVDTKQQIINYLNQEGKSADFIAAVTMWFDKVKKESWTIKLIQYKLVDLYKLYDSEALQIQSIVRSWDRGWCSFYKLPKAEEKGNPPTPLEKEEDDYVVEFGEVV